MAGLDGLDGLGFGGDGEGDEFLQAFEDRRPGPAARMYGLGFDAGPPQVRARSLSVFGFSRLLVAFLGAPAGFPPILGSVFFWRCSCRQTPPCTRLPANPGTHARVGK